jgi:hypothetical protein
MRKVVSRELPCSSKEITSLFVGYPESDMRVKLELLIPGVQYAEETGGVPGHVEKEKWRILPVGEVHDEPAALAGSHRRNAPWERVSASHAERMSVSPSRSAN